MDDPPQKVERVMSSHKTRIMYIERKAEGLNGPARIGRVTFSKTGRTISIGPRARTSASLRLSPKFIGSSTTSRPLSGWVERRARERYA
jgi:hypothetical protein